MAQCEICGSRLKQKLAATHDGDAMYDITYFPQRDADDDRVSVPRNYFCSVDCAIQGLKDGQPKEATESSLERREELMNDE